MKRPNDKNWLDEALTKAIGSEETKPNFEKWKQEHPEAVEMLTSRAVRASFISKRPLNIRKIIMKNPITKLAVAAVVIIACVIGLTLWRGTQSGIALADVLARIEQVKAYRYKSSWKITIDDPNNLYNFEHRTTNLVSQEYGSKQNGEQHLDPNIVYTFDYYFLPQKKITLEISPKAKKCLLTELDDTQVERMRKQNENMDPRSQVKKFLEGKYESLGRSTINGIEVEGFQITHPTGGDEKMWVDVKTLLPVRYEFEVFDQVKKRHTRVVIDNCQWDVSVDAAEFEPVIPDDYIVVTDSKKPAPTEEDAMQGLKLYGGLSGRYPDTLYWTDIEGHVERIKENVKGLTEEKRTKRLKDIAERLHETRRFYYARAKEKGAEYYGKTVTPKDADKVLMRWKVSDNEYRVIYGDLHTETVTSEKLVELEAALPK